MTIYYRKWTKEENDYVIANVNVPSVELAEKLNKTRISVENRIRWLRSKGIIPMANGGQPKIISKYGENLKEIKKDYESFGFDFCIEKYGMTMKEIRNLVSTLGFKKKEPPKPKYNYFFDKNILLNPTKEFAYCLGVIWGDGFINKKGGNGIFINAVADDYINIAPYLLSFANWKFRIKDPKSYDGVDRKTQIHYTFCNKDFHGFLVGKGYLEKSGGSPQAIIDYLPDDLKKYWWRGYFDADGHITVKIKENMMSSSFSINITSCYNQDWDFLTNLLKSLDINNYVIYKSISKKSHKNSQFRCQEKTEAFKFLSYIYEDFSNIGFCRKYLKYIQLSRFLDYKKENPFFYREREYTASIAKQTDNKFTEERLPENAPE